MLAVAAAAAIAISPGLGTAVAKRYAQMRAGQPAVMDARVVYCHGWYGAVKCWMRLTWRPAADGSRRTDSDVVLVARCGGRVRAWDAAVSNPPRGCERVLP